MMRCEQVIRELAAPSDDRDSLALASHLKTCPKCTTWAQRAAELDHLWIATRPAEPSSGTWETVWSNVVASLESTIPANRDNEFARSDRRSQFDGHSDRPSRTLQSWSLVAMALAQAAAILVAVTLAWSPKKTTQIVESLDLVSASSEPDAAVRVSLRLDGLPVVIDEGHLVVIREAPESHDVLVPIFTANQTLLVIKAEGPAPRVLDRTPVEGGFGVDDCVMYNVFESITSPVVAMKE
jgi:hypothetical protein